MLVDEQAAQERRDEILAAIAETSFPCLGAKSTIARGMLRTVVCRSIESGWDDVRIHSELLAWSAAYRKDPAGLRSLAGGVRSAGRPGREGIRNGHVAAAAIARG